MPFGIQPVHLIVIALVALIVFGPSKLPDIGRGVGKALSEFRRGMRDMSEGFQEEVAPEPARPAPVALVSAPVVYQPPIAVSQTPVAAPALVTTQAGTFYCSVCGAPNAAGSRFCNACGSPITVITVETPTSAQSLADLATPIVNVEPAKNDQDEAVVSTNS